MAADVWVMQKGVANMHMARSHIWDWKAARVAAVPGVARATPILYGAAMLKAPDKSSLSYVVGLPPGGDRAGPWKIAAGKATPATGEAIVPKELERMLGVGLGGRLRIADRTFRIVGLSDETYSLVNSIVFVTYDDLAAILSARGSYSYILVDLEQGRSPAEVAEVIEATVEKVSALPQETFLRNDFEMSMQMGVEVIAFMSAFGSALAALIVGFTAFTQALRQRRELAILKALGFRARSILLGVLLQTFLVTAAGCVAALALTATLVPTLTALVPQVKMMVSPGMLAQTWIAAVAVAVLAASLPAALVNRVDPVTAFKG
jgi:ABC-type antimicrobial peptide transport system permease subunit